MERFRSLLPPGWFGLGGQPLRDALLAGMAAAATRISALTTYARNQARLSTLSSFWLDIAALDFFGLKFQRRRGEADESFRPRIIAELLRPRATRQAIVQAVTELTGTAPDILEPYNPGDCGGYGIGTFAYAGPATLPEPISGYGMSDGGYGVGNFAYVVPAPVIGGSGGGGAYGSLVLPNQFFVTVHRPSAVYEAQIGGGGYGIGPFAYGGGHPGIPSLDGYGSPIGGYGVGSVCYGVPPQPYGAFTGAGFFGETAAQESITDAEIFATIAEATPAGVIAWTRIRGV